MKRLLAILFAMTIIFSACAVSPATIEHGTEVASEPFIEHIANATISMPVEWMREKDYDHDALFMSCYFSGNDDILSTRFFFSAIPITNEMINEVETLKYQMFENMPTRGYYVDIRYLDPVQIDGINSIMFTATNQKDAIDEIYCYFLIPHTSTQLFFSKIKYHKVKLIHSFRFLRQ